MNKRIHSKRQAGLSLGLMASALSSLMLVNTASALDLEFNPSLGIELADDWSVLELDWPELDDPFAHTGSGQSSPPISSSRIALLAGYQQQGDQGQAQDLQLRIGNQLQQFLSPHWYFQLDSELRLSWPDWQQLQAQGYIWQASLEHSRGPWQQQLGWQSLNWGAVMGAQVLDVASPSRLEVSSDIGGSKVPQLMFINQYYGQSWRSQSFVTPWPSVSLSLDATSEAKAGVELGQALYWQGSGYDLGLYAAWLYDDLASLDDQGQLRLASYGLLGSSLSLARGLHLWDWDLAVKLNKTQTEQIERLSRGTRVESALGWQRGWQHFGSINAFVRAGSWLQQENDWDAAIALAWNREWTNQRLALALTQMQELRSQQGVSLAQLSWNQTDAWQQQWQLQRVEIKDQQPQWQGQWQLNYFF